MFQHFVQLAHVAPPGTLVAKNVMLLFGDGQVCNRIHVVVIPKSNPILQKAAFTLTTIYEQFYAQFCGHGNDRSSYEEYNGFSLSAMQQFGGAGGLQNTISGPIFAYLVHISSSGTWCNESCLLYECL